MEYGPHTLWPEQYSLLLNAHSEELCDRYQWGSKLGKGGFGQVRVIVEVGTKREFACKSISKRLDVPNFSPQKQAAHLDNIRREVIDRYNLRNWKAHQSYMTDTARNTSCIYKLWSQSEFCICADCHLAPP